MHFDVAAIIAYYIQHVQVAYLSVIINYYLNILYIDCYIYLTLLSPLNSTQWLSQIVADLYQGDFLSAVLSSQPL